MELVEQSAVLPELKWQDENPPFDETAEWDMEADIRIMDELPDRKLEWLEKKRQELGARWMLVVDGEVLMHGPTVQNYPISFTPHPPSIPQTSGRGGALACRMFIKFGCPDGTRQRVRRDGFWVRDGGQVCPINLGSARRRR